MSEKAAFFYTIGEKCGLGVLGIGSADASAFQLVPVPAEERNKRIEMPERVSELKPDQVIKKLKLKQENIVAGSGAYSISNFQGGRESGGCGVDPVFETTS